MHLSAAILSVAIALALGAMSPGPSFLLVARTALAASRKDGLAAAVGMGVGSVALSIVALLGLLALLSAVPFLHLAMKVAGGTYLLYLGYRIWQGAGQPLAVGPEAIRGGTTLWRSFLLGLTTQVSNPKTAVVYASVFASLLPSELPISVAISLPVMIFVIETAWYSVVAIALSAAAPRARYLASKKWIDRAAGTILSVLGAKLIFESTQT